MNGPQSVGIAAKVVTVVYCISRLVASVIVLSSEAKNFTPVETHVLSCTVQLVVIEIFVTCAVDLTVIGYYPTGATAEKY